jgi:hypothetical protein
VPEFFAITTDEFRVSGLSGTQASHGDLHEGGGTGFTGIKEAIILTVVAISATLTPINLIAMASLQRGRRARQ